MIMACNWRGAPCACVLLLVSLEASSFKKKLKLLKKIFKFVLLNLFSVLE